MTTITTQLADALRALMRMDVRGHQLQDRLQFSDAGRALLNPALEALAAYDAQQAQPAPASEHTAEPWTVGRKVDRMIYGVNGDAIAECDSSVDSLPRALESANARRIVACVNACAGIPTASLEAGIIELGMDTLDNYRDISGGEQFPPRK